MGRVHAASVHSLRACIREHPGGLHPLPDPGRPGRPMAQDRWQESPFDQLGCAQDGDLTSEGSLILGAFRYPAPASAFTFAPPVSGVPVPSFFTR